MRLEGHIFDDVSKIKGHVEMIVSGIGENVWNNVFKEWISRLEKCVQSGGEYME